MWKAVCQGKLTRDAVPRTLWGSAQMAILCSVHTGIPDSQKASRFRKIHSNVVSCHGREWGPLWNLCLQNWPSTQAFLSSLNPAMLHNTPSFFFFFLATSPKPNLQALVGTKGTWKILWNGHLINKLFQFHIWRARKLISPLSVVRGSAICRQPSWTIVSDSWTSSHSTRTPSPFYSSTAGHESSPWNIELHTHTSSGVMAAV